MKTMGANIKGVNLGWKVHNHARSLNLFCAHTLCMSYVTNTFLLVSSSVWSKHLLCFVHGQGQKSQQKRTTKNFVGFLLTMHTSRRFMRTSLFVSSSGVYTLHARWRNDTNFISFQSQLIFLTIRQTAEVCWHEVNRTDHGMFGCRPVLLLDIHEGNPLSPSFLGFRPLIIEKWYLKDRDTSFLVFRITTPINNALLYHFRMQLLPHI